MALHFSHFESVRSLYENLTHRKRRDHMHAGLSLPPRVDDRALTAAHHLKEPAPGLGIDGLLAEGAVEAQQGA